MLALSLIYRLAVAPTHLKARCTIFCHPPLSSLPRSVVPGCANCQPLSVSANAMQMSVTHQLLKQTPSEENSALQTQLHAVALASFAAVRKNSVRISLWHRAVSRSKANGANCVVTCALSNCQNEVLTNRKLACCMKTEMPMEVCELLHWTCVL